MRVTCLAGAVLVLFAVWLEPLSAADADARLKAHLEAGEFAPAVGLAQQAQGKTRDAYLAQIAAAQAQAGARRASLATVSEIESDLLRAETLRQMSEPSTGGGSAAGSGGSRGGNRGGGAQADFDSLIDLITSTVAPTTWDTVGGPGSIAPFATGVYVDAHGLMHRLLEDDLTGRLDRIRQSAAHEPADGSVRRTSALRKVSLPRLEREAQLRLAAGESLDDEMRALAGLQRINYVLVYPETGDIVLAGPAGDWRSDREGRLVSVDSGRPVMQLDDLIVVLRLMLGKEHATFGCAIKPTQDALARVKAFTEESSKKPLASGTRARDEWLKKLRDSLGEQEIEYYDLDPRTRVTHVLVEADYRMKLVGIGLEDGTLNVPSYLSRIRVPAGQAPPPLGVLRWWFALNYQSLVASGDRQAFEFRGPGAKVLSENELLTETGQRIHTGQSEPLNEEFAHDFTRHFDALAAKYPIYAELRNIFDMALAAALIKGEDLPGRVGWHMTCFNDPKQYQVQLGFAPKTVETVINHKIVNRTQIVAVVSGGVFVDPKDLVQRGAIETDRTGKLGSHYARSAPENLPRGRWWWD
jgi:hypothetical protein